MAHKYFAVSDLTGKIIEDSSDVVTVVVLDHPTIERPVQLDAARRELAALDGAGKDFVLVELLSDGGDKRERVALELADFDKLFKTGEDVQDILEQAEPFGHDRPEPVREAPKRRGRPAGGGGSTTRPKSVDYTDLENIGVLHRGRLTDREKELVQANFEKAQENRRRMGQPEIDLTNTKEVEKYGLQAIAEKDGVKLSPEFKS